MRKLWLAVGLLAALPGCGPSIPTRFVLERDVDGWAYRRYQRVLDVELAIEGNPAVGHTATYVRRASRTSDQVPFANVFVSVYERPEGLAAEVRRLVRGLASYESEVRDYGGGRVWYLDAGPGDRWCLWVSGNHVVKVGASETQEDVPEEIVSAYMGIYSSDLDEHGRAREGTPSAGELPAAESSGGESTEGGEGDDDTPAFLRENAPR
ncbi:MAG: hypothetical protein R3B82_21815 [Sandaracinaceae bacterium]